MANSTPVFLKFSGGLASAQTGGDKSSSSYIPNPSSYSVKMSDLDLNSTRTNTGGLDRNRLGRDYFTVSASWQKLTQPQLTRIIKGYTTNTKDGKFTLTFYNPFTGSMTSQAMYAQADRTASLSLYQEDENETTWSFSIEFIAFNPSVRTGKASGTSKIS